MFSNSQLKRISRKQLKKQWIGFGLFYLLFGFITGGLYLLINREDIVSVISFIAYIYFSAVCFNLAVEVANNKRLTKRDFIVGPKVFFSLLGFNIAVSLISIFFVLIFVFFTASFTTATIMGVPDIYSQASIFQGVSLGQLAIILVSAFMLLVVSVFIFLIYQITPFVISKKIENIGIFKAMRFSRKAVNGYRSKLFGILLSFVGWYLLPLILLIGIEIISTVYPVTTEMKLISLLANTAISVVVFIWVIPYSYTTVANFFYELILEKKDLATEYGILNDENVSEFRVLNEEQLMEYGVIKSDSKLESDNNYENEKTQGFVPIEDIDIEEEPDEKEKNSEINVDRDVDTIVENDKSNDSEDSEE